MNTARPHRFLLAALLLVLNLLPSSAASVDGKHYAVLIGINHYNHAKLPQLKYPENDVSEMAGLLKGAGYEVTLLTAGEGRTKPAARPTKANIDARLKEVLNKCQRDDVVLIALAGHGLQFHDVADCFFCPQDAKPFEDEASRKTLVSLAGLYADLDRCGAGTKLLVIDACRNDPAKDVAVRGVNGDTAPRPPRGVAALFSCSAAESAFESGKYKHGIFFYHLLEGMRGKAKDVEGEVTWDSLAAYVRKQVPRDVSITIGGGARQTPTLSSGELSGEPPVLVGRGQTVVARAALSLRLYPVLSTEAAELGLTAAMQPQVVYVVPGGGADRIGLKRGDVLVRLNGREAPTYAQANTALQKLTDVQKVTVVVRRGRKLETLSGTSETPFSEAEEARRVREQADQGDPAAMYYLAGLYTSGHGVEKNDREAAQWYRKAADLGNALARQSMAILFDTGRGVKQDRAESVQWYRKAAEQGNPFAQYRLGVALREGRGVTQNMTEAAQWIARAAEQGEMNAQNDFGVLCAGGRGVAKDAPQAARWYRKAAEQGHVFAQCNLAFVYENGRGVVKDVSQAAFWFQKAADRGNAKAQNNLGRLYAAGNGVPKDEKEAAELFTKAANQGYPSAEYNLGLWYRDGRGVPKNETEAIRWFTKAAAQGDKDAKNALAQLGTK